LDRGRLVRVDQHSVPAAASAFADHNALIKEAHHSIVALYALALAGQEAQVPTAANWFFRAQWLSVFASEAEMALPASTFHAVTPDDPLEIAFFGACVVFQGHFEWNQSTCIALEWPEEVIVVGVPMSSDLVFGKRFQVCKHGSI
jgi:hypothetical protein